jgi:nucleotide-binding universal stress UspA family protein
MKHLLVATDGSAGARAAVDYTSEVLLRALTVEQVTLISVYEEPVTWMPETDMAPVPQGTWDELRGVAAEQAQDVLREAAASLAQFTGRVKLLARGGRAGREIVQAARELRADIIVIGSHRLGELRAALFGSVEHAVVEQAPCPVLVVRPPRQR